MAGGGPIIWKSALQTYVAGSTLKAEFTNLMPAIKAAIWVHDMPVMLLDWRPFWIGLDRSNWISLFAPELNLARQSLDQIRKCPSSGLDWIESPIQLQSNPITSLGQTLEV